MMISRVYDDENYAAVFSGIDPMSSKTVHMLVSHDKMAEYINYKINGGLIQDALPSFDAFEREFIKTGYGPESQEALFGVNYEPKVKVFLTQDELLSSGLREKIH